MEAIKTRMIHTWTSRCAEDVDSVFNNGVHWSNAEGSPVGSNLSPDADGVYPNGPRILVDLSQMGSQNLGRQLPMTANYRVTGITIGIQNCDDVDDNDRGAFFNGYIHYYSPTMHRMDAMQTARRLEDLSEQIDMDAGSSLWPTQQRAYRGFRFGWNRDDDIVAQTNAGNVPDWAAQTGLTNWSMSTILYLYGQYLGGGLDAPGGADHLYTLWDSRTGATDKIRWACSLNNANFEDPPGFTPNGYLVEQPSIMDFHYNPPVGTHLDIMGGLLLIEVRQCNTIPNGDISPDDYDFTVGIEVEGWSSW